MTKPLDIEAVAARARDLLRDLPCELTVEKDGLLITAPASENVTKQGVYARLVRRFVRGRFSRGQGRPEGWQITNDGGYGQADTRTFTSDAPDPRKVAASLAEVARRRAGKFALWAREREKSERATNLDIETAIKVATLLGVKRDGAFSYTVEDDEKSVRPEHGTGRVTLMLKSFHGHELRCWPDEIHEAVHALKNWQREVGTFGQPRNGSPS